MKTGLTIVACLGLSACTDAAPVAGDANLFNGTAPTGFGEVSTITLPPAIYPVSTQPDFVFSGGSFPVRRVDADRILNNFSGMIIEAPDGTSQNVPAPVSFSTWSSIRVGGTDDLRSAVLVALSYCGLPAPDADMLYRWGDEPIMRAVDTQEFQFTDLC